MQGKGQEKSKRLTRGLYSLLLCVVVTAIVFGVNLLFSLLPQDKTKIDTTAQGIYTLSEQTKDVLGALSEDVELYLITEPGKEDEYTRRLLDSYADHTDKVRLQQINPLTNPLFASAYTDQTVENNSVIVASAKRSKVVLSTDMYTYGFDYVYYTYATVFNGESLLTNAIRYVTDPDVPVVYALTGHGEIAVSEALSGSVSNENIDVREWDLLSAGKIPDDAEAILIFSPTSDIAKEEKDLLTAFLDKGGDLILVSGYTGLAMENLYSLMAGCGMEPMTGVVIEGDDAYSLSGYAYYLLPDMEKEAINEPLIDAGRRVLVPAAMGIGENDHRSSLSVRPLYTTSGEAYLKKDPEGTDNFAQEEGDIPGSYHVGMISEETHGEETSRTVWFASDMMFTAQVDELSSGTNASCFANALSYVTERSDGITVREKSTITPYLTITTAFKNTMLIVTAVLLPLACLLAGAWILIRRRRRQ